MFVERVEIEGGFLSGLDITFSPGFNTIIGARGSGKTSLLELIRFCLGASVLTEGFRQKAQQQAMSVLGDGRITLTLRDAQETFQLSRSVGEQISDSPAFQIPALILAQNEIEAIGIDSASRLRLLDGFVSKRETKSGLTEGKLRSLQAEISALQADIENLDEQMAALAPIAQDLIAAKAEQKKVNKETVQFAVQHDRLKELTAEAVPLTREQAVLRQYIQVLEKWLSDVARVALRPPQPPNLEIATSLEEASKLDKALQAFKSTVSNEIDPIRSLFNSLEVVADGMQKLLDANEAIARPIRAKLEELSKGSGEIERRVASLQKRVARGEALAVLKLQRSNQLKSFQAERDKLFETLNGERRNLSHERSRTAKRLTDRLKPSIRVEVLESSNLKNYEANLAQALRGSGLQVAPLTAQIAKRIPPRQLLQVIEENDKVFLSKAIGIAVDRAARLINALAKVDTSSLVASLVDDDVRISLLDVSEYKPSEDLSTGQRCTAVLPILLETETGVLIIDQPEDHLDNAFVVETLIKAINDRRKTLQLIVSTHNANLPVLGSADMVIQLNSDGRRAFQQVSGHLDNREVVGAITTVMEGGREAFERRAQFYHKYD